MYRGVNHGPGKTLLVPVAWQGPSVPADTQTRTWTGPQVTAQGLWSGRHPPWPWSTEACLPYKLSTMLYLCNNHDCGVVNRSEKAPKLCPLGTSMRWARRHLNQKVSVDSPSSSKAGSDCLADVLMYLMHLDHSWPRAAGKGHAQSCTHVQRQPPPLSSLALMSHPAATPPLWHSNPEGRRCFGNLHFCPYQAAICPSKDP